MDPTRRPHHEATLAETLADPLINALMQADRVDARALETMLREIAAKLAPAPAPAPVSRDCYCAAL
jgi:hypothetical protein